MLSGCEIIPWNDVDVTFKRGSRCIDSIAMNEGIMTFVEGFEFIDWDEKNSTDHRGRAIELNLEHLFNKNMRGLDAVTRSQLNPRRSSHK